MLLEKLKESEIELYGLMHHPRIMSAVLFPSVVRNFDALANYDEEDQFKVKLCQLPFQSYEYLLAEDDRKTAQENFEDKQGAGTCYAFTGRGIGKSLISLLIDMFLDTIFHFENWVTIMSSFDESHVARITDPYIKVMRRHPFLKLFKLDVKRKPAFTMSTETGHVVNGVNMCLSGREPGSLSEGLHAQKTWIDETQYMTEEVQRKMSQSIGDEGTINRWAGITSFPTSSPAYKAFKDSTKKNWVVNLPKTISNIWNKQTKAKAIEDYNSEVDLNYKIHILAEVVENIEGLYQIDRIMQCMNHNRKRLIKRFEVDKINFSFFKKNIVIERPENAKRVWLAGDFGSTAPSELIIVFEIDGGNNTYFQYRYNITLIGLIPDEQYQIYDWLVEKLKIDFIGIDTTEWGGRQITEDLKKKYGSERIVQVHFSEKVIVDHEKNDDDSYKLDKGKLIPVEVFVIDWAVEQIKKLFYNKEIDCFYDTKLERQFAGMVMARNASRIKYGCTLANGEDHLHAAFQVFAFMSWLKKDSNLPSNNQCSYFKGVIS